MVHDENCDGLLQLEFSGFTLAPLQPQYCAADGGTSRETLVTHVMKAQNPRFPAWTPLACSTALHTLCRLE